MANIAQMVNVLQSLVLTQGERMLLTPTYHVFDLYKNHQGATSFRTVVESSDIPYAANNQRHALPALSASASRRPGSRELTLTVTNAHATLPAEVEVSLRGAGGIAVGELGAWVVTHDDLTAHNTFDAPDALAPQPPAGGEWDAGVRVFPPASVTALRLGP
jgi:alpha-N-arabinofuranosidase